VGGCAPDVLQALDDLFLAPRRRRDCGTCCGPRHRRRVPCRVRAGKEADLDACFGSAPRHRVELGVRLEEDAAALRDAVDANVEPRGLLEHGV
jgi:hypothetical protein